MDVSSYEMVCQYSNEARVNSELVKTLDVITNIADEEDLKEPLSGISADPTTVLIGFRRSDSLSKFMMMSKPGSLLRQEHDLLLTAIKAMVARAHGVSRPRHQRLRFILDDDTIEVAQKSSYSIGSDLVPEIRKFTRPSLIVPRAKISHLTPRNMAKDGGVHRVIITSGRAMGDASPASGRLSASAINSVINQMIPRFDIPEEQRLRIENAVKVRAGTDSTRTAAVAYGGLFEVRDRWYDDLESDTGEAEEEPEHVAEDGYHDHGNGDEQMAIGHGVEQNTESELVIAFRDMDGFGDMEF